MAVIVALIFFYFISPGKIEKQYLASYRNYTNELKEFRSEFGGAYTLPPVEFYLFGMGNRTKYIFNKGSLINIQTGLPAGHWAYDSVKIIPNEYTVMLFRAAGKFIRITEDENGVWIYDRGKPQLLPGTASHVSLPVFNGNRYDQILKVLHQEILINIVDSQPLPNLFVYRKPWRRVAAMMAMCLAKTGNLDLIRTWFFGISDPYDHNNGHASGHPENEADNLGESLYLISLFEDKNYPLVQKVMDEEKVFEIYSDSIMYIRGRTDFQEVPVYQTKWLMFGLKCLGVKNNFSLPLIPDNYSSLFWWDFKDFNIEGDCSINDNYPYIEWARDHFYGWEKGMISNRDYPLTWEREANEADYGEMSVIDSSYVQLHLAVPHSGQAAEIFLYLTDKNFDFNNE